MTSVGGYVHVVATRIGVGVYDEEWFRHRLALFEAITVPSMANQTSGDFTWLLVIDKQMPQVAYDRLMRSVATVPNIAVERVEFKSDIKAAVCAWAARAASTAGVDYVLTSRLDDDDALALGFFERLHSEVETFLAAGKSGRAAFSFTLGSMWIPAERLAYTRYHDSHSLGLSVLEPVDGCRGIHAWPHQEIKQRLAPSGAYLRGIDGDELWWLYATHLLADSDTGDLKRLEKVRNHRYGYRVDDRLLDRFGLSPTVIDALAQLPQPRLDKPVKRLAIRGTETEREIVRLRRSLEGAAASEEPELRRRLAQLESDRRDCGTAIVASSGPQPPKSRPRSWFLPKSVRRRLRQMVVRGETAADRAGPGGGGP